MRTLIALAFALCSCQILPQKEVVCADSDRCEISIATGGFVLGQPDAKTNWLLSGLNSPRGVLFVGGKLLVADTFNNRVLIWNSFPTQNYQPADLVLGQEQLTTVFSIYPSASEVIGASQMASDGTRLVVSSDAFGFNRIQVFNNFPIQNNQAGSFFIDPGSSPSMPAARNFIGASPVFAGTRMGLSDRGFNRFLVWDTIPTTSADANYAVGQPDLTSGGANAGGVSATSLNAPNGTPASDGTHLFLPDSKNNRVMVWNAFPPNNVTNADFVLGHSDFVSVSANRGGGPRFDTLSNPQSVSLVGGKLLVADTDNNRVLIWNTLPTSTGQAADLVLGQPDGTSNDVDAAGIQSTSLFRPAGVATDGTRVAVADTNHNRVLLWNSFPSSNGVGADVVLGQATPTKEPANGIIVSQTAYITPLAVARAGNRLVVVDRGANRVLLWPSLPQSPTDLPNIVLGQPDFNTADQNLGAGPTASGLDGPRGASSDGNILAVADTRNNRVVIWKTIPTQTLQPADLVLGQNVLTTEQFNNGGPQLGLDSPQAVFVGGGRIYVADTENDRVLIWKSIPTMNHQPPDIVLGQADFSGIDANRNGSPAANTLNLPTGVFADTSRIYVSDTNNLRVLIWNTLDPTNGQAADLVIGQVDFSSQTLPNNAKATSVGNPGGLTIFNNRFFVADAHFHRILFWNSPPTITGVAADGVVGQADLTGGSPNAGGLANNRLQNPSGVLVTEAGMYIADPTNARVVVLPTPM